MKRRHAAAIFLLLLAVVMASPPAKSGWKAVLLVLDALPSPVRPLAWMTPEPRGQEIRLVSTDADLYTPRGLTTPPGIVMIHGANPEGKDDPRVRNLALSIARTGRRVLVPNLSLRNEVLDLADKSRIREALQFFVDRKDTGVIAFSYGAGLTLVTLAGDQDLQDRVRFVATVGTYFDLTHVIQGITTGTAPYRGENVPWTTVAGARDLLAGQLSGFIGAERGDRLAAAWRRKDPSGLEDELFAVYELLENRDPSRARDLAEALPADLLSLLKSLSPSNVTDRIHIPVFSMHAVDDPAAPPSESRLLIEAIESRVRAEFIQVGILRHVDPIASPLSRIGEARKINRFARLILSPQEGWPRL